MKDHIKDYKRKLEKAMCQYMECTVSERTAETVRSMAKTWNDLTEMEGTMWTIGTFTEEQAKHWNDKMVNDDGTMGGHWKVEDTTKVAESIGLKFEHITPWAWNTAMNMVYSDYCTVATKMGVSKAEFYAEMAKAFLFDKDGGKPMDKMSAYYCCIVDK